MSDSPARPVQRGQRPPSSLLLAVLTVAATALAARAQQGGPAGGPPAHPRAESRSPSEIDALPVEVRAAYQGIRGDRIAATIRFLASPRLEGREAGERGAEVAADYLASRFQAVGLQPGSRDGFLQRFDLIRRTLAPDEELTLIRRTGGATNSRKMTLRTDWIPFSFSEIGTIEAPLVFAGYGVVAPENKWDDYAVLGADGVRGKVVVVFRHEPDEEGTAGSGFFEGREMTLHASLRQKARAAAAHGAVGLIVVDDPLNHEMSPPSSALAGWNILGDEERKLPKDDPKRPRGSPGIEGENEPLGLVAAHASQELLRWISPGHDWKAFQKDMDSSRKPRAFALPNLTVRLVHAYEVDRQPTANVVAVLPGSDPVLAKEYVLVGGHYDHLGTNKKTGQMYPGADDNASGTSAIVAVAEAFASLPRAPARSLLFVGWSAEEKGLLGSNAFVRKPAVPLDRIVAGVNLDMVSRNKEGEMSVVGRPETPDFVALFDRFAPDVGLSLNDDAGAGAGRSDNGPLWLGGVPTVSLFAGTHPDYHDTGDTADKVLPGKVEKAARLTFLAVREVAEGKMTPVPLAVPTGPWKPIAPRREAKALAAGGATPAAAPATMRALKGEE